jgi:hypothetical protein
MTMSWSVYHAEEHVHDYPRVRLYYGYHIGFADGGRSEHPFDSADMRSKFEDGVRRMVRRVSGRRLTPAQATDVAGVWCVLRDDALTEKHMREQLEVRWKLTPWGLRNVFRGCAEIYDDLT